MCILESWQEVSYHTGNCQVFCGLGAGTKIKKTKQNTHTHTQAKFLKSSSDGKKRERTTRPSEGGTKRKSRQEEKGTMTAAKPKWVVCGFVHSADISGGAACHSYGCFRTIQAHTHTHSPREQCGQGTLWQPGSSVFG